MIKPHLAKLYEYMKECGEQHRRVIRHPEFRRLYLEKIRLDAEAAPQENRMITVCKEFYKLVENEKILGFNLRIEE